jgi:hypothetical protein
MKGFDIDFGHSYYDIIHNKDMLEFHIDYWDQSLSTNAAPFQPPATSTPIIIPTTSLRVSSRATPLIIVGQDESVSAQYLLGSKTLIGPAGQYPLHPKSEGDKYICLRLFPESSVLAER